MKLPYLLQQISYLSHGAALGSSKVVHFLHSRRDSSKSLSIKFTAFVNAPLFL